MIKALSSADKVFLDEKLYYLRTTYGGSLAFFREGMYVHNKNDERKPHEWWAPALAIAELERLIHPSNA